MPALPLPYSTLLASILMRSLSLSLFSVLLFSFFYQPSSQFTFLNPHSFFILQSPRLLGASHSFQSLFYTVHLPFPTSSTPPLHHHSPFEQILPAQRNTTSCVSLPLAKCSFSLLIRPSCTASAHRPAQLHQVLKPLPSSNRSSSALHPSCTLEWTLSSPPVRPQPTCTWAWVAPIGVPPWRKKPLSTRRARRHKPKRTRVSTGLQG